MPDNDDLPDRHALLRELGIDPGDPQFADAIADAQAKSDVITELVRRRALLGLDANEVALRMGARLSEVRDFERIGGNQTLSMMQRYARAVGCRLKVSVR